MKTKNPFKLDDNKAQYFSDLWWNQRDLLTVEQKDRIGINYLTHILTNKETTDAFISDEFKEYHQIGLRQAGAKKVERIIKHFGKK